MDGLRFSSHWSTRISSQAFEVREREREMREKEHPVRIILTLQISKQVKQSLMFLSNRSREREEKRTVKRSVVMFLSNRNEEENRCSSPLTDCTSVLGQLRRACVYSDADWVWMSESLSFPCSHHWVTIQVCNRGRARKKKERRNTKQERRKKRE